MSGPLEIELKWALEAAGHAILAQRIPELLGPAAVLEQDNRFCDSADGRLRAAGLSVRLRRENRRLVLTCKSKAGVPGPDGLHRHGEIECELDPAWWESAGRPAELDLPLPPAWRAALASAPLTSLGGFANRRLEFHDGVHLVCLDRTALPAGVDHELELETPDPAAASSRWKELLAAWNVPWRPQGLTKLHRFLAQRSISTAS